VTDTPEIGVGMLGYAFMGKAHAHAYRTIAYMTWPPPLLPRLVRIAGRSPEAVAEAANRYGFDDHSTDWRELIADERVGLFDNSGPNVLHAEPTIAAAEAGKHVVCEKPLGRTAHESYDHELHHLLAAIREDGEVEPHGASLRDGYRASEIADAIARSADTGARVEIAYRDG
jgi:predicted dehydrogenase